MTYLEGSLGSVLVNSLLPKEYRKTGPVEKGEFHKTLREYARNDPRGYAEAVPHIKSLGDEFSTYEGVSVGLDDISPQYSERDPILNRAQKRFWSSSSPEAKKNVLLNTQESLKNLTLKHPGDLGLITRSGGRGGVAQMMKATTTPVVIGDYHGAPIPYLIGRGYSEGLAPAEHWIASDESRSQVIKGQLGTADPGELGKIMATMMSSQVIARDDCGTTNGISMLSDDPSALGRFEAVTNRLLDRRTLKILRKKKSLIVRSPMTCELPSGVCKKCQGTDSYGRLENIGTNIGIRSAQAMAEPLTQMALSSKHGVSFVSGDTSLPKGVTSIRQFLETPSSFMAKATLSSTPGVVTSVNPAPQGGYDVFVGNSLHYVPPDRQLLVGEGDRMEAGDSISNGIPSPVEIVNYKGLGAGRKYLLDAMHNAYLESGISVDKRHLESLARSQLNHYRVGSEGLGPHLPGEIIPANILNSAYGEYSQETPLSGAIGKTLAAQTLHHLPGTVIDKRMTEDFQGAGIKRIVATDRPPGVEPYVTSASRVPLLNPNWMQRLGHRYQKATLIQAANFGEKADIHSHNPIPALVFGKELRRGQEGTY